MMLLELTPYGYFASKSDTMGAGLRIRLEHDDNSHAVVRSMYVKRKHWQELLQKQEVIGGSFDTLDYVDDTDLRWWEKGIARNPAETEQMFLDRIAHLLALRYALLFLTRCQGHVFATDMGLRFNLVDELLAVHTGLVLDVYPQFEGHEKEAWFDYGKATAKKGTKKKKPPLSAAFGSKKPNYNSGPVEPPDFLHDTVLRHDFGTLTEVVRDQKEQLAELTLVSGDVDVTAPRKAAMAAAKKLKLRKLPTAEQFGEWVHDLEKTRQTKFLDRIGGQRRQRPRPPRRRKK